MGSTRLRRQLVTRAGSSEDAIARVSSTSTTGIRAPSGTSPVATVRIGGSSAHGRAGRVGASSTVAAPLRRPTARELVRRLRVPAAREEARSGSSVRRSGAADARRSSALHLAAAHASAVTVDATAAFTYRRRRSSHASTRRVRAMQYDIRLSRAGSGACAESAQRRRDDCRRTHAASASRHLGDGSSGVRAVHAASPPGVVRVALRPCCCRVRG